MIVSTKHRVLKASFVLLLWGFVSTLVATATKDEREQSERNLQRVGSITRIDIYNAETGAVIGQVSNGMTITLSNYGLSNPNSLIFSAATSGTVRSVKFTTSGSATIKLIDNTAPFALCGTSRSIYLRCTTLTAGTITLTALPFSSTSASGRVGQAVNLSFTIVAPTVTSPTGAPKAIPVAALPTATPKAVPVVALPTAAPIAVPVAAPPTAAPKAAPVARPTVVPTRQPTKNPTSRPITPPVSSSYDVTLSLIGSGLTQSDITMFQSAANRWKQIVVGDVQDIPSSAYSLPFTGCTAPSVIDDLLICGKVAPIDGKNNVIGYAGPTWIRGSNSIPFMGQMVFDSEDVAMMRTQNIFYSVMLHEMGHVMGIGTMWERTAVTGTVAENCPYKGVNGNREYSTISGCTGRALPTEQDGGDGTRCGHFDEECFKDELMTGYASGTMPISRLTVATLQDLGYTVNYEMADPYTTANMNSTCVCKARNLRDRQLKIVKPIETLGIAATKKRRLSDDGFNKAREFGKKILLRGRRRFHKDNIDLTVSASGVKQKKAKYIGDDFITVIYNDGINGIFGVVVTVDDIDM